MYKQKYPIILASQSPRRKEILQQLGITFSVQMADIDESSQSGECVEDYLVRIATAKALKVQQQQFNKIIIAADTVVTLDGEIFQKPLNLQDAIQMWQKLSGRIHQVKTAVAVAFGKQILHHTVSSDIHFKMLSIEEMQAYWQTGEPCDKAGGYAIQGLASQWVEHLSGSYSAVVGLPIFETIALLQRIESSLEDS